MRRANDSIYGFENVQHSQGFQINGYGNNFIYLNAVIQSHDSNKWGPIELSDPYTEIRSLPDHAIYIKHRKILRGGNSKALVTASHAIHRSDFAFSTNL